MRTRNLLRRGSVRWFEYYCWEGAQSSDSELWYRSHQVVKVLCIKDPDSIVKGTGIDERARIGQPIVYKIRFADGHVGIAFEDELLTGRAKFARPHPPGWSEKPCRPKSRLYG